MKLLVATRNRHKLEEIRAIFRMDSLELLAASDIEGLPEVEEDGDTFEANAIKKAATMARESGLWTLADDSGLEVDALDGEPGVRSARYAGEPADYQANNDKLLRELGDSSNRRARFRCVIALSDPRGECRTVSGSCEGSIIDAPRGEAGFGYDPLFVPEGYDVTFAEMDAESKNRISHRGKALERAQKEWEGLFRDISQIGDPDWGTVGRR